MGNGYVFGIKKTPESNKDYNDILYDNDDLSIEDHDSAREAAPR